MQVKPNDLTVIPTISIDVGTTDSPAPDIEKLLEYKEHLEKELHRVKTELRKKVQR
jgi:hypothetical protein